jgi:hypothetical protein
MVEATLLAAMISRRMYFDLPRGSVVEAEAAITQRPRHGLPMTVHMRQGALSEPAFACTSSS